MNLPSEDEIIGKWPQLSPPLVTLLCVTYNHEKYVSQTLDSFLMQETDFPFEIVIGEDCSTDKTRDVIKEYQEKYPRLIHLVTGPKNVKFANNFSRALESCRGKYIAHCEGDDYWTDPKKVQIQTDFMEKHPEYVLCGHGAVKAPSSGVPYGDILPHGKFFSSMHLIFSTKMAMGNQTRFWRNVIRKLPPEALHVTTVDLFMWSMLGHFGKGICLDEIKPSVYRINETSIWTPLTERQRQKLRIQAYFWMSVYYARRFKPFCAFYFFAGMTYVILKRTLRDLANVFKTSRQTD